MRPAPLRAWAGANFFCRGVRRRSLPIFWINGGVPERRRLLLLLTLQMSFLRKALAHAGFSPSDWIENPSPQNGMFSSLQEASRWVGWLSTLTHWIISLGDQPHIQISTLRLLLNATRKNPTRICQPAFHGRAAHPIILPANNFRELAQSDIPNLRAYVRTREAFRLRVAVEDAAVSHDLNTPEDYTHWKP